MKEALGFLYQNIFLCCFPFGIAPMRRTLIFGFFTCALARSVLSRSNPTNTRSLIRKIANDVPHRQGNLRTNVGTARIWLSRASCGFFKRSITSIWYLPFNRSSQITLRLLNAVTDFGVCPATYKRNAHLSLLDLADCFFHSTSRR